MARKRRRYVARRYVTAANAPRVWTGDRLFDRMLEAAGLTEDDLRETMAQHRAALQATLPDKRTWERNEESGVLEVVKLEEGGAPDWPARLRAGETIFGLVGSRAKRERDAATGKPAAVTIILADAHAEPRALLRPGSLSIHLAGNGNGHANGNGHDAAH